MTLVPEIFLARELELCYAAICYVVNYAEGIKDRPYQPGILFEGLATPQEIQRVKDRGSGVCRNCGQPPAGIGENAPAVPLSLAHGALPAAGRYRSGLAGVV